MPESLDYGRTPRRRTSPARDILIGVALSLVLYAAVQAYIIHAVRAGAAARAAARSATTPPTTVPTHP